MEERKEEEESERKKQRRGVSQEGRVTEAQG